MLWEYATPATPEAKGEEVAIETDAVDVTSVTPL
jgi:hypothetical protein